MTIDNTELSFCLFLIWRQLHAEVTKKMYKKREDYRHKSTIASTLISIKTFLPLSEMNPYTVFFPIVLCVGIQYDSPFGIVDANDTWLVVVDGHFSHIFIYSVESNQC